MGGSYTHEGALRRAQKGWFMTLLSPPQCYAAFGTMPHTLASMEQSLFAILGPYPPRRGRLGLDFGGARSYTIEVRDENTVRNNSVFGI
jgi:hypothetical protein